MPRVLVPLADGFEEMEGIIIIDVLRRAGVEVLTAGLRNGEIVASRNTRHVPDTILRDVADQDFDMIILPGGAEGARNLEKDSIMRNILLNASKSEKPIAAICAAPNILRNLGIIKDADPFTLHPATIGNGTGGSYQQDSRLVRHKNITTSVGPGSAFEFALDLVEQLCGKEMKNKVASPMQLPV